MKFCRNCKHAESDSVISWIDARCYAPQNEDKDITPVELVRGSIVKKWRWNLCELHRTDSWLSARMNKTCGREGRWFMPK